MITIKVFVHQERDIYEEKIKEKEFKQCLMMINDEFKHQVYDINGERVVEHKNELMKLHQECDITKKY